MTEQELRALLRDSKEDGQRAIFQQYSNYVYTIVYSKLRSCASHEDIEECVSDVFAEVFMYCDAEREGSLQGYIGIVAKRIAINTFHRLSRRPHIVFSLDEQDAPDFPDKSNIQQDYEQKELCENLLNQVKALGEPDSSIIIQKYFYQRNSNQIGKILSLSPATVRKRCERAIKRLKEMLSKEEDTYETKAKSS